MSATDYLWIYGLAEACAVTLLAAVVFGLAWWRLYRERMASLRTCRAIAERIRTDIDALGDGQLGGARVAYLESLARPFASGNIAELAVWNEILDDFQRAFPASGETDAAAPDTGRECAPPRSDGQTAGEEAVETAALDADIDQVLEQYQVSLSSFSTNRGDIANLTTKCRQLEGANRELRQRLETASKSDLTDHLLQELSTVEQSNIDFMRMLSESDQHQNALATELERLEASIHHLKSCNQRYRKLVQEILLERDSLAEQKKQLLAQVERLNRTYDSLRLEYIKLYRVTH